MSAKQKLLDAENRGWSELHSRFDKLSDEDWLKPGVVDDWTPKDMIAHVAVWHAQTADRLEALRMTGELPKVPDVDAFNADQVERNRDLSLHDARVISGAARHRFREEIDLLDDDPDEFLQQVVFSNADGHYEEHIPHLDAFLGNA